MAEWIGHDSANQDERLSPIATALPAIVGLDTEFMRVDTFAPKLALIQIEFDGDVALIDPLADVDFSQFGSALSDPLRTCIMHSASEDLEALVGIVPNGLGRLYDTQIAAAFAGMGAGLSYQKLVFAITGVELEKGETRSDWLRRPLSAKQLEYAAHDVEHLPEMHAQLGERLKYRGFVQWHAEDCVRMLERARDKA
ncbi:MAG: ribonuclease D, partial [Dokdonella sp.]